MYLIFGQFLLKSSWHPCVHTFLSSVYCWINEVTFGPHLKAGTGCQRNNLIIISKGTFSHSPLNSGKRRWAGGESITSDQWHQSIGHVMAFQGASRQTSCLPIQCSCLENSMERGAWWAIVQGVTKSRTQLSNEHSRPCNETSVKSQKDGFRKHPGWWTRTCFYFSHCMACGILLPWLGTEPFAVEGRILNLWTTREVATVLGPLSGTSPYGSLHLACGLYPSISFIMKW